jgi:uncharacterized membrane protein
MKLKIKLTPVSVLSIIIIPLCIIGGINFTYFDNKGGQSLLGVFLFGLLVINIILLFIEQAVIKKSYALKKVWIIELSIILTIILLTYIFSD